MIVVTGGAGFIGSNLHAALAARGLETIVVDRLRDGSKWRNLARHAPARIVLPEDLDAFLATNPPVQAVFHLGDISATTARDGDLVWQTNVELSLKLWHWGALQGVRFIYASSAATYGSGAEGFDDDLWAMDRLRPLNLYGWSKLAFDRQVARLLAVGAKRPPQWAGLKFFNVYGPNEYHKGSMISVVKVKHDDVLAGRAPRVGDIVAVLLFLLDTPGVNGLFNLGTGVARSYADLARAVCRAAGVAEEIEYIDMPASLRGQYQSFTQARMERLRDAGYGGQFTSLEDGVCRYVQQYLAADDPYV